MSETESRRRFISSFLQSGISVLASGRYIIPTSLFPLLPSMASGSASLDKLIRSLLRRDSGFLRMEEKALVSIVTVQQTSTVRQFTHTMKASSVANFARRGASLRKGSVVAAALASWLTENCAAWFTVDRLRFMWIPSRKTIFSFSSRLFCVFTGYSGMPAPL